MKTSATKLFASITLGSLVAISPAFAQEKAAPAAPAVPAAGVSGAEAAEGAAPELTEAADLAIERGFEFLIKTQKPDGSWNEGKDDKPEAYPHKTPMAIIILGTPHRYIPVYQE